jgi:peptide/nickel transport system ATP-binding protein
MTAADPAAVPLLSVRGLGKSFPRREGLRSRPVSALRDVSFDLQAGEALAVVGESGSGKSTLARLIACLLPASAGEIRFRGADVLAARRAPLAYRAEVQMIFQDPFSSLNPARTVGHHLARPLEIHGKARGAADVETKIRTLLETVGLGPADEIARKHPHQLSGGQRQRVAIARALAVDPALILADEPTSMLDASVRIEILALMRALQHRRRIGLLLITHDLGAARAFADRVLVLYAGQVVEEAPSGALLDAPAHPYTELLRASLPDPERPAGTPAPPPARGGQEADSGCSFRARCPKAMERCQREAPRLQPIAPGRLVRCHLWDERNS